VRRAHLERTYYFRPDELEELVTVAFNRMLGVDAWAQTNSPFGMDDSPDYLDRHEGMYWSHEIEAQPGRTRYTSSLLLVEQKYSRLIMRSPVGPRRAAQSRKWIPGASGTSGSRSTAVRSDDDTRCIRGTYSSIWADLGVVR